jgi:hypothetical protein
MPGSEKNSLSSIASMMKCITNTKPNSVKYPRTLNQLECRISWMITNTLIRMVVPMNFLG